MSKTKTSSVKPFELYDATQPLAPIYKKRAAKELKEDPAQISAHLESFRRWIKSMPHLNCNPDDGLLLAFLRQSKYNHLKAQTRFDKFCTFRSNPAVGNPEWFQETDERREIWKKWLEQKCYTPLGFTQDGVIAVMMKCTQLDLSEINMSKLQGAFQLWSDYCLLDQRIQIGGFCMIVDLTGLNKETLTKMFDPKISKSSTKYFQECLPLRINKLIYFNSPKIFESLFKFYVEWLSEKIKSKIMMISGDMAPAFEAVPGLKDLMPKELGGNNKLTFEEICEKNFDTLMSVPPVGDKYSISVDESKRPKEAKYSFGVYKDIPNDVMGTAGTYVKLNDEI